MKTAIVTTLLFWCLAGEARTKSPQPASRVAAVVAEYQAANDEIDAIVRQTPWLKWGKQKTVKVLGAAASLEEATAFRNKMQAIGRKLMLILAKAADDEVLGVEKPLASIESVLDLQIKTDRWSQNAEYQEGEVWLLPAIHIATDAQSTSPNEVVVYNGWMLKVVVDKQRIVRVMEFQQANDGKQVTVERK